MNQPAWWADALTLARALIALILIPVAANDALTLMAVLTAVAWLTDLFDGRLARMTPRPTHLGPWDMSIDTAVGAGVLIGLVLQGWIPWPLGLAALLLFGGLYAAGNVAASMLLQLSGFVPMLLLLSLERPDFWWLPAVVAFGIGIADWRKLLFVSIPAFIRGIAGRFEGHRLEHPRTL